MPLTLSIYVTQSTKVEVSHVQNVNDLCTVPMILQLTGTQVQALLASISRLGSGEKIFNDLTFSNPVPLCHCSSQFHHTLLLLSHCSTSFYYHCDSVPLFHCSTVLYCYVTLLHFSTVVAHFTVTATTCHCFATLYYHCDTSATFPPNFTIKVTHVPPHFTITVTPALPLYHCCTSLYYHCDNMPLSSTTLYYHYPTVPPRFTITVTLCHLTRHCDWLKPNPGPPIANFSQSRCFSLRRRRNLTYDA